MIFSEIGEIPVAAEVDVLTSHSGRDIM